MPTAQPEDEKKHRLQEMILGSRFIPWKEAAVVGDMFSVAAVARLLALRKEN